MYRQRSHTKRQGQDQEARLCLRCGFPTVEARRCKLICANCGYQECCSDACLIDYADEPTERGTDQATGRAVPTDTSDPV